MGVDLSTLNDRQLEAVQAINGVVQIPAIPGSGKTRVLTTRIAYMLEQGIDAKNMLVTTFSKKAAEEMKSRLELIVPRGQLSGLTIGTLHSIAYRILQREYIRIKDARAAAFEPGSDKIIFDGMRRNIIRDIINDYNMGFVRHMNAMDILRRIDKYKSAMVDPLMFEIAMIENEDDQNFSTLYREFEQRKEKRGVIDFGDMLSLLWELLGSNDDICEMYQRKFQYILSDESQDMNQLMYNIIKLLGAPQNNVFIIGDEDQCQPPGSMVLTQEEGYLPIEQIDPGKHHLVSYARGENKVIGLRKGYGFRKAVRHFSGELFKVNALDKETMCTPEHKWLVKWNNEAKKQDKNVVYLMQQGDRFRIGWCQLFKVDGSFHLGHRTRLENADAAWILKVIDNKTDAYTWESIISSKYGIPTITFEPTNGSQHITKETINRVFDILGEILVSRAEDCLRDFGLSIYYPIWSPQRASLQQGGASIMELETCNILPRLMMIPVYSRSSSISWETIKISKIPYDGDVYSLDVDEYHTYVVDDLVTHNCIYGFNGASPSSFTDFTKDYEDSTVITLEENYRSHQEILNIAERLINNNTERLIKRLLPFKRHSVSSDVVTLHAYGDEFREAEGVIKKIGELIDSEGAFYHDFAIVYRTNAQTLAIEHCMVKARIPYTIYGGRSFYERAEVMDMMAYLRLAINPDDDEALLRIYNKPNRYLGKRFVERLRETATEMSCSYFTALRYIADTTSSMQRGATSLYNIIISAHRYFIAGNLTTSQLLNKICTDSSYYYSLNTNGGDVDDDPMANAYALENVSYEFNDPIEFVDYMRSLTSKKRSSTDMVQLMTIHRSKGLEFRNVFVVGVSQGLLPSLRAINDDDGSGMTIEEERRLAYVAVTRAKERVIISTIASYNGKDMAPSMFLGELGLKVLV